MPRCSVGLAARSSANSAERSHRAHTRVPNARQVEAASLEKELRARVREAEAARDAAASTAAEGAKDAAALRLERDAAATALEAARADAERRASSQRSQSELAYEGAVAEGKASRSPCPRAEITCTCTCTLPCPQAEITCEWMWQKLKAQLAEAHAASDAQSAKVSELEARVAALVAERASSEQALAHAERLKLLFATVTNRTNEVQAAADSVRTRP